MRRRGVEKLRSRWTRSWAWSAGIWLVAAGCGELQRSPEAVTRDGGVVFRDAEAGDAGTPCNFDEQHWLIEGETLRVPLRCPSGRQLDLEHVELIDAPDGMELDLEHGELRWSPALDQAANYLVELQLDASERGRLRVGVADRFEDPNNVPIVDALRYTHELGLPVFHIGAAEDINKDEYTPATLSYAGEAFADAQAKYRGATSSKYPKRSFTLKLDKTARFTDAARGFYKTRRLVLTSTFDDNSQLRQRLAFELWNRLDPDHVAIKHFNAVVYVNGQYHGVYAVTDHLNDDFLESLGYPETVNLYKARQHDANFRLTDRNGEPKTRLTLGYTKEAGEPAAGQPGSSDDLVALVTWLASATDEEFRDQYATRLAPDFEHWFILVSLIAAPDTATKNYFLVHDARPDAPDTRWRFAPWDFNASFGQNYRTLRRGTDGYRIEYFATRTNHLFERIAGDPALHTHFAERYRSALDNEAAADQLLELLDRYAEEVHDAALRDELRWEPEQRAYFTMRTDFISHEQEIAYLRGWIAERWRVIADELGPR